MCLDIGSWSVGREKEEADDGSTFTLYNGREHCVCGLSAVDLSQKECKRVGGHICDMLRSRDGRFRVAASEPVQNGAGLHKDT